MECFTIMSNELEGAINPERYKNSLKFDNQIKIKDFAEVINELFVPAKKYPYRVFDWLRIDKVKEGGFLSEDSIITTEGKNIDKSSVQFAKEGDILIARLGPSLSNEKILIAPKTKNELVVSGEFIILRPKNIEPEIIVSILKTNKYLRYILSKGRGGTPSRLRINRDDFLELDFPKIDKNMSVRIFNLIDGLKNRIKSKEAEAQKLLDSINDYVLDELGIKLPELEDKMIFVVNSDDVKGRRIDAYYYQPKFEEIEKAIKKGKYEVRELREFIIKIHYGASVKNEYVDEGIPLLRIMNLKPNNLDLRDIVKLPESMRKDLGNAFVKEGDLLISRSGTVGMVSVVPKEAEGFAFGSFMIKFCLNEKLNKNYISAWLNTKLQKLLTEREKIGAIQGNITIETIENFKIPLPPLPIQNKIAGEVKIRMQKAEQLQKEAKEELEKAKQEVERIILG